MVRLNAPFIRRRLPPERFYWAVLDESMLVGRSKLRSQLGFLFEHVLPVTIEEVQATYAKINIGYAHAEADVERVRTGAGDVEQAQEAKMDGRRPTGGVFFLACGIQRSDLDSELGGGERPLVLAPESLPPFVLEQLQNADALDPERLNLLHGAYEPLPIKSGRRRWIVQLALSAVICTSLLTIGLQRRTALAQQQLQQISQAHGQFVAEALGNEEDVGSSSQPPELRVMAELRTLRQTRQDPKTTFIDEPDAVVMLASLLDRWPKDLLIQTDSILVSSSSMTIRAVAYQSADVQRLADALNSIQGWRLGQPQINVNGDVVQATLQLKSISEKRP